MNELKALEDRLNLVTSRISSVLEKAAAATSEKNRLEKQLADMKKKRAGDLEELDKLLEELKPLLEGEQDA